MGIPLSQVDSPYHQYILHPPPPPGSPEKVLIRKSEEEAKKPRSNVLPLTLITSMSGLARGPARLMGLMVLLSPRDSAGQEGQASLFPKPGRMQDDCECRLLIRKSYQI